MKGAFSSIVFIVFLAGTLMMVIPVVNADCREMYVSPDTNTYYWGTTSIGFTFRVTVWVADVQNLNGWQVRMDYDASKLSCTGAWIPASDNQYVFREKPSARPPPFFGTGYVLAADAIIGMEMFTGSGKLLVVEFSIIAEPQPGQELSCLLQINRYVDTQTFLYDNNLANIRVLTFRNGYYRYIRSAPTGNLVADAIEPVQVIWGANLIEDKKTDFKLTYTSTFTTSVQADVTLYLPDFTPSTYTFTYNFAPGSGRSFVVGSVVASSPFFEPRTTSSARFKFTIDPSNVIAETDNADNTFPRGTAYSSQPVTTTGRLRILFIPVRFSNEALGSDTTEFNKHVTESSDYLKATFPIDEDKIINTTSFSVPYVAGIKPTQAGDPVHFALQDILYALTQRTGTSYERIVGAVRSDWFYDLPGTEWDYTTGVSSPAENYNKAAIVEIGWWSSTPHEIGHTYGLVHNNAYNAGYYVLGRTSVNAQTFMSTGELPYPPALPSWQVAVPGFWLTISDYAALTRPSTSDPELLQFAATFWPNGTVAVGNWYRFSSGMPDMEEGGTGNYTIAQYDHSDKLLSTVRFNVSFVDDLHGHIYSQMPLAFTVPFSTSTKTIRVLNSTGDTVASRTVSSHSPTVHVISPNGGETLNSSSVQISWTANDEDGDPMVYCLMISGDQGETWTPIEVGLNQTTYDLPLTGFPGGDKYRVRVMASDGVNTSEDGSDGYFTVSSFAISAVTPPQNVAIGFRVNYTLNIATFGNFSSPILMNANSTTTNALIYRWINGTTINPTPNSNSTVIVEVEAPYPTEAGYHTLIFSGSSGNNTQVTSTSLFIESHNLAVAEAKPSQTAVGQGYCSSVNITVQNRGNFEEIFVVDFYLNETFMSTQTLFIAAQASVNVTFALNTTGFNRGVYALIGLIQPVEGETYTVDNVLAGDTVLVGVPCDVTGIVAGVPDGVCNMRDVGYFVNAWLSTPSSPRWNANCDVTGAGARVPDGVVNMRDIGDVCVNFGKT